MTTAYWKDFWGSSWRRTNPYGSKAPWWNPRLYSKGYHRGEDIANRGSVAEVPALRAGSIIDSGRSGVIGYWVCIQPDEDKNRRDIYCHMYDKTAKRSGHVDAGDIIGRTASKSENPGTGWSGPHLHFVISTKSHGGFETWLPDYDPRPIITAALANPGKPAGSATGSASSKNLRTVTSSGPPINGRATPTTSGGAIKQKLNRGVTGTFDGFIRGEKVNGNNIWFRGAFNGNYFWSGNFTSKSTKGLKDLGTYKAPAKVAKKEYARLSQTWFYYNQLNNALNGNYSNNQKLPRGDYLVIKKDSRGPIQIKTKYGNVWVGTRRTKAPTIKK